MDFENAFELFSTAFSTLLEENYYFALAFTIGLLGMVILYLVTKLTNRD